MNAIQVLIVDDEPLAQEILESYLLKLPGFEIVAKCKNALEAFIALSKNKIDIMFLDINMPEINGIEFLKTIKDPPYIIFTTAYTEYAVESYEYGVMDYLLKPISFERFLKSINKSLEVINLSKNITAINTVGVHESISPNDNIMFVKSDGKLVKINLNNLWFVEALKDYVRLWTEEGKIIVHSTMKNIEEQLSPIPTMLRVHKSYIINIKFISEVDGNVIRVKDQALAIGNTYKDEVYKILNNYKLM